MLLKSLNPIHEVMNADIPTKLSVTNGCRYLGEIYRLAVIETDMGVRPF